MDDILVYAIGYASIARFVGSIFKESNVTGFDIDSDVVAYHEGRWHGFGSVQYTAKPPSGKFDVVFGLAALGAQPDVRAAEMVGFLKPGGIVGVLDYDMRGMDESDFLRRWGWQGPEKQELQELGPRKSWELHTVTSIGTVREIMAGLGIVELVAEGGLAQRWPPNIKNPTIHLLYVGKKPFCEPMPEYC
ncbi:MAG: class I SAM-dependent methyltransferase [Candidatus Woesearchaeota archaeon]